MKIDFENVRAFDAFTEPVRWTEDASPHRTGTFRAVINRGAADSLSAGSAIANIVGDVWSVCADLKVGLCANVQIGDTIERLDNSVTLTVQKVIKDDAAWWLICTANEKVPQ